MKCCIYKYQSPVFIGALFVFLFLNIFLFSHNYTLKYSDSRTLLSKKSSSKSPPYLRGEGTSSGGLEMWKSMYLSNCIVDNEEREKDIKKNFLDNNTFPNPIKKFLLNHQKNKKVAAALAFPFPFGCVGLHRVFLGTAPHVPIVYAATAGGVFGLIPLIDCITLLIQKDISDYENNSHVIMWISHPNSKKEISETKSNE